MRARTRQASLFRCGLLLNACAMGAPDAAAEAAAPFLFDVARGPPDSQVPPLHLELGSTAGVGDRASLGCPVLACGSPAD
eukprot:7383185-Prymnesium_polylepis.1